MQPHVQAEWPVNVAYDIELNLRSERHKEWKNRGDGPDIAGEGEPASQSGNAFKLVPHESFNRR